MYLFLQQCTVTFCNSSPSDTDSVVYSIDRNTADNLPCDQHALGYFKNEIEQGKELLTFTSTGPKSYFIEIGYINEKNSQENSDFSFKVTDTIARSKSFCLSR